MSWGYTLSEVTGPLKPLVATVDGLWTIEEAGTGCRITWTWTVHPRGRAGALAMPLLGRPLARLRTPGVGGDRAAPAALIPLWRPAVAGASTSGAIASRGRTGAVAQLVARLVRNEKGLGFESPASTV